MSSLKKIFFLSLFFFGFSLLFWGIYVLSFKKTEVTKNNSDKANTNSTPNNSTTNPPVFNAKISNVSNEAVISPIVSQNGNSLWYFSPSGELKESLFIGGDAKSLSDKKFPGILKAVWSPDKSKVLLKIKNADESASFSLFDTNSNQVSPLNRNINEVAWMATSDKIFYKYFDSTSKKSTLNISDPNGNNWKKLMDLPHDKISFFQIPRSGLLSVWNNGDAYYSTLLQSISLLGDNPKTLYQGNFGADYLWDNSGNYILASQTDAKGGTKIQLGIMNYNGGEYKILGLPTFASKCLWSNDDTIIYCALPGNVPDNSILPNDYKAGKFTTTDTFWKINISTGEKSRLLDVADIKNPFDASNLFFNSDESLLFFVNKVDGKLYKIVL
jgi:hypothetical protein